MWNFFLRNVELWLIFLRNKSDIQQLLPNAEVFWKSGLYGEGRVKDMVFANKWGIIISIHIEEVLPVRPVVQ